MSALFVVIVFAAAVLVYLFVKLPLAGERGALPAPREKILRVGEATFLVEVADTAFQRAQGLAGREFLARDRGMLFVFEKSAFYRFTMAGMRFPLDFVWIREGRAIGVTAAVMPEVMSVEPPEPVDMVLEINAGVATERGIKAGDEVALE